MKTVLIIEDDILTLKVLEFKLKAKDYKVIDLRDGRYVSDYLERFEIDVYILDLNLPYIIGETLVDEILKYDPKAKIIITSMKLERSLPEKLFNKVVGFLQKPYTKHEFQKLNHLLSIAIDEQ